MFFKELQDVDLAVRRIVTALDLVLTEISQDKHWFEKHAETADTVEGHLRIHAQLRKVWEHFGVETPPLKREELQEGLSRSRDRTDQRSGAYEKRIAEIDSLKSQVQSRDVPDESAEKILEILMVGLARSTINVLNSIEFEDSDALEHMRHILVYAHAIKEGFESTVDLKYPFDLIVV